MIKKNIFLHGLLVVDLDVKRSPEQQQLVRQYYQGSIPHVLVLDAAGKPLYNSAGEVDSKHYRYVAQNTAIRF